VLLLACTVLFVLPALAQSAPAETLLITAIDTPSLARAFGVDLNNATFEVNTDIVICHLDGNAGKIADFAVGVYSNIEQAQQAFTRGMHQLPIAPFVPEKPLAGEQFVYWKSRLTNRVLLRRMNCIVSFRSTMEIPEMVALAQQIDGILLNSDELAPKGNAVFIPAVTIAAPATVPIGGMAEIRLQSTAGNPIRIMTSEKSALVEAGGVRFASTEAEGTKTVVITMATAGNVIFTREVTIEVVSKEQYAIGRPVGWAIPGDTLYFLTDPNLAWETIPLKDREWLLLHRGTFQYIASGEREHYSRLALDDLRKVFKADWLPEPELFTVSLDHATDTPTRVAYASYTLKEKGCNIVCLGGIGTGYLWYIEQPYPLPRETKEISVEDVLLSSLITPDEVGTEVLPQISVMHQSYVRFRSLQPRDEFQQVKILLIKVSFPDSLNLRFPNYR